MFAMLTSHLLHPPLSKLTLATQLRRWIQRTGFSDKITEKISELSVAICKRGHASALTGV